MASSIRSIGEPCFELLYEAHVDLEPPQVVGQTPLGMRQIFYVKGGTFEGPRMRGEILPGGGDWALIRPDGALQLDVRATVRTDDGDTIYVHLFPKPGWPHKAQGRAYVLAWQDYAEDPSRRLDCYRWLMSEAKLSLGENVDRIIRWLEGR